MSALVAVHGPATTKYTCHGALVKPGSRNAVREPASRLGRTGRTARPARPAQRTLGSKTSLVAAPASGRAPVPAFPRDIRPKPAPVPGPSHPTRLLLPGGPPSRRAVNATLEGAEARASRSPAVPAAGYTAPSTAWGLAPGSPQAKAVKDAARCEAGRDNPRERTQAPGLERPVGSYRCRRPVLEAASRAGNSGQGDART